ncbi:MAG: hypothetical protein ACK47B_09190 [Armatimonadota bacterium]
MTGYELCNYREGMRIALQELAHELRVSRNRLARIEQLPEVPAEEEPRILTGMARILRRRVQVLELARTHSARGRGSEVAAGSPLATPLLGAGFQQADPPRLFACEHPQ